MTASGGATTINGRMCPCASAGLLSIHPGARRCARHLGDLPRRRKPRAFCGRAPIFRPDDGPNVGPVGLIQPDSRGVVFGGEFGLSLISVDSTLRTEQIRSFHSSPASSKRKGEHGFTPKAESCASKNADLNAPWSIHSTFSAGRTDCPAIPSRTPASIPRWRDGKLWTSRGVVWIDPHHLATRNPVPPYVAIRSVIAARRPCAVTS